MLTRKISIAPAPAEKATIQETFFVPKWSYKDRERNASARIGSGKIIEWWWGPPAWGVITICTKIKKPTTTQNRPFFLFSRALVFDIGKAKHVNARHTSVTSNQ